MAKFLCYFFNIVNQITERVSLLENHFYFSFGGLDLRRFTTEMTSNPVYTR